MRRALGVATALFLLSPVLIFAFAGILPSGTFSQETIEIFGFTIVQAAASALLAIGFGLLGAYGLQAASEKWGEANGKFLEALSLLPNVAPVLIFLLAIMKFTPGLRGLAGIIVVHALLNTGLVATSLLRILKQKVAILADLAWVEGTSKTTFFLKVVLPLLAFDLVTIFSFVFAICFSSLAVPLMIGGSRATTLEVLIWQAIRIDGDFSRALGIAIVQMFSILLLTLVLRRRSESPHAQGPSRSGQKLLSQIWGLPFAIFPALFLLISMLDRPWVGAYQLFSSTTLLAQTMLALAGSFIVALATGALVAVCLLILAFVNPQGFARKVLIGYVAPSSVITGFALIVAWREIGFATYVKITLAITLVSVPAFYRLYWDASLRALECQRQLAKTLGAGENLTFWKIVFPQLIRPAAFVAGLAALWAWGDFALSRTIAERDVSLGMMIQSLMGSYRFELATFLVWILLLGGAVTFFIFQGVGRVFGQKPAR